MALTGSLNEIGIIDLIQFPHQGRKTGRLSIKNGHNLEAHLFYKDGTLVHATNGKLNGIEAIVTIVDVEQADFVFESGVSSKEDTINMDVHHTILSALKIRDERKAEQERINAENERRKEQASIKKNVNQDLQDFLSLNVDRMPWINYLAILGEDATVVAEAVNARKIEDIQNFEPLKSAIINFLRAYPNGRVGKVVIDDGNGITMISVISQGHLLLLVGSQESIMGAVVTNVSKIAGTLHKMLEEKSVSNLNK